MLFVRIARGYGKIIALWVIVKWVIVSVISLNVIIKELLCSGG